MKAIPWIGVVTLCLLMAGCSESQSDLTKEDKVKMDKLFREGVKPPGKTDGSTTAPKMSEGRGEGGQPINAADK